MEADIKKTEIANQIKNAFEFIQRLYHESSYLIKEIEGQLGESEYRFQILKPSGYSVSSRSSTGLEANNVSLWLLRKFSVAFVEEDIAKGQNFTEINKELRVLYFKIKLDEKNLVEPKLLFGVFYDIEKYKDWVKKFEHLMGTLEYVDDKMFSKFPDIDYGHSAFRIKGKFEIVNLLDINSSLELNEKVIEPAIKLYEQIKYESLP
jgi:hypothetical protein